MEQKQYKPRKDKFTKARGGSSKLLSIFCAQCNTEILLYQKDGPGDLLRMYLDKILAPDDLVVKVSGYTNKSEMESLACRKCYTLMAVPMVYDKEDRLAYRIVNGEIKKEPSTGKFPSILE